MFKHLRCGPFGQHSGIPVALQSVGACGCQQTEHDNGKHWRNRDGQHTANHLVHDRDVRSRRRWHVDRALTAWRDVGRCRAGAHGRTARGRVRPAWSGAMGLVSPSARVPSRNRGAARQAAPRGRGWCQSTAASTAPNAQTSGASQEKEKQRPQKPRAGSGGRVGVDWEKQTCVDRYPERSR